MNTLHRVVSLLIALLPATVAAQGSERYGISGKSLHAHSALFAAAWVTGTAFYAVGGRQGGGDISIANLAGDRLLPAVAEAFGLVRSDVEGAQVFAPEACRPLAAAREPEPRISDETVTVVGQHIAVAELMGFLATKSTFELATPQAMLARGTRRVAVRVRNVPASSVYRVISAISGVALREIAPGRVDVVEFAPFPCGAAPASQQAALALQAGNVKRPPRDCPRYPLSLALKEPPDCDHLEYFDLAELRLAGYVSRGEHRWALIEAPDGYTHIPQLGSHLGFDFGRIRQVDAAGVHLHEVYRDAELYYRERLTVIDWDGRRRRTELPLRGVEK